MKHLLIALALMAQTQKPASEPPSFSTLPAVSDNWTTIATIPIAPEPDLIVQAADGSRVVKLSDEEYQRLQKLRQAVADEERRIAEAHGVRFFSQTDCLNMQRASQTLDIQCDWDALPVQHDHYEFSGQWLLVNLPERGK